MSSCHAHCTKSLVRERREIEVLLKMENGHVVRNEGSKQKRARSKPRRPVEKNLLRHLMNKPTPRPADDWGNLELGWGLDFNLTLAMPYARPAVPPNALAGPQVRVCVNCGKDSTPVWRNGPWGRKTLCNACGLRYFKQEKILSSKLTLSVPEEGINLNAAP